jgi:hypothetical protein
LPGRIRFFILTAAIEARTIVHPKKRGVIDRDVSVSLA